MKYLQPFRVSPAKENTMSQTALEQALSSYSEKQARKEAREIHIRTRRWFNLAEAMLMGIIVNMATHSIAWTSVVALGWISVIGRLDEIISELRIQNEDEI